MAASIQNHCHLDTVNPPVATYSVISGSWDVTLDVPLVMERGLTGLLHYHRILDEGGDVVQFEGERFTIRRATLAQMLTLRGLAGKVVYYVSPYHDEASLTVVSAILVVPRGGIVNLDPMGTLWNVQVELTDIGS